MTTQEEVSKLNETIQSLQLSNMVLKQCYAEEIDKNINQKAQIIFLNAKLEEAKKTIDEMNNQEK